MSFFLVFTKTNAQVGIGTTAPNVSAMLDAKSASKGMLVPRVNTAQRKAIITPADGLMVYDIDTKSFWFYKGGTDWIEVSSVHKIGFSAYLENNQTIVYGTYTTLAPYNKLYDYNNNFNINPGVLTVPETGLYHFTISVVIPPPTTTYELCIIRCFVNGNILTDCQKNSGIPLFNFAGYDISVCLPFDVILNTGNAFSYQFLQFTGANQAIYGGAAS